MAGNTLLKRVFSLTSYDELSFFHYQMPNTSASPIAPAATPSTGYMNHLFEEPEERFGDDRRVTCVRQDPLLRAGTAARDAFDRNNLMMFEVRFKIYTDQEVDINTPNQSTPKVGAGKKAVKSSKLNLIDSKALNSGYLEMQICPYGKSVIEFKELVAGECEKFEPGMKNIILNSPFSSELKWKTTMGQTKSLLTDYNQWHTLVETLDKSIKKKCILLIENENVQVKAKEGDKAKFGHWQASATKKLIATTNGGGSQDRESEESIKERELATIANKIFSQYAIEKSSGGPGKVLTAPWDPTFFYRLTYAAAWIWANGVVAKIATNDIPPNTSEFRYEIKKSRWIHPDMGVDHRVDLRLQGKPRGSHGNRVPQVVAGGSSIGKKREGSGSGEMNDIKPDIKKIKVEPQAKNTIQNPIYISSEYESDWNTESVSSSHSIEIENPSASHSVELELFLADCEIAMDDEKTRTVLKEAGIKSWTDLIPSLQLTEATLTKKGLERQIANRLLTEAQARFSKCKFLDDVFTITS
ncbi:uncharacterized protein MELLADRAFT_95720 [Melampsora larici-populina 98AG31]|uniref:Uncharacterized protein n=1 Tax=Melampsora larici-populina (strain 98AG31 / pathotype 3-4-7) TaxID=747676 RepID=F4SAD4_MELLP|nr:uncharacterized protein MELLADRAFT_95720 [Melampsora larici-populina 98AG31]EGF98396.1 hypothetical protein MELLADRAFT_95720 [Melampsora larici-populina 98AG31]